MAKKLKKDGAGGNAIRHARGRNSKRLVYLGTIIGSHDTSRKPNIIYCPYNALKEDGIERMRQFPELVAEALMLEHQSLSLNPRGTLYRGRTLLSIITDNHHIEALRYFRLRLEAAKYALYRVRAQLLFFAWIPHSGGPRAHRGSSG